MSQGQKIIIDFCLMMLAVFDETSSMIMAIHFVALLH